MLVVFSTDGSVTRSGWTAQWGDVSAGSYIQLTPITVATTTTTTETPDTTATPTATNTNANSASAAASSGGSDSGSSTLIIAIVVVIVLLIVLAFMYGRQNRKPIAHMGAPVAFSNPAYAAPGTSYTNPVYDNNTMFAGSAAADAIYDTAGEGDSSGYLEVTIPNEC